jgi:2-polyprenyl-3-methyl-5-hydroxy-6-metoxy-1,4-benzoquinol methylase
MLLILLIISRMKVKNWLHRCGDMAEDELSSEAQMAVNRLKWDERVPIHIADRTGIYDVPGFLRGNDTLKSIEDSEIGDVSGRRIAHLQCHFGLDSLSLARRGATVTGLDFSQEAVTAAKGLAEQTGLGAEFVCGNVYDAVEHLGPAGFDMVYVSWGAIIWLPDIARWAAVASRLLVPGGRLYLADLHPALAQLEEEDGKLVFTYPRRSHGSREALKFHEDQSYAGNGAVLGNKQHFEWIHPLSDIVTALHEGGLRLDFLHEHDMLPWPGLPSMVPAPDGMYRFPDQMIAPPVAFSLGATARS